MKTLIASLSVIFVVLIIVIINVFRDNNSQVTNGNDTKSIGSTSQSRETLKAEEKLIAYDYKGREIYLKIEDIEMKAGEEREWPVKIAEGLNFVIGRYNTEGNVKQLSDEKQNYYKVRALENSTFDIYWSIKD